MDLIARSLLASVLLAMLMTLPAQGQLGDAIPHAPYYVAVQAFYTGEYRDAERALRRETQRGVRAGQARWIDSICYHAMLGEVLYHEGRNAEALVEFDQACQLLLAYPDWLLQVRFQSDTGGPRTDPNLARRVPPWGRSGRQFALAQFPATEQVFVGELDAARTFQEGGVVRQPMFWRVNVVEVLRNAALAIRRRNELLGPLVVHDPLARELSSVLSRGNLAPANHWSAAWIDLLRGMTQAGVGKPDEADMLLGRSLVIGGQFDHPLTCVGLLEQGRLAMIRGDTRRAASLFAEAGFSAYYYENWDVLTESIRLGWINHLSSGGAGVYAPLEPVAAWAQANRFQHITVTLRLAQAESLLWLGQLDAANNLLNDATRRIGQMRTGLPGIHQLYVQAAVQIVRGQLEAGAQALVQAVTVQAGASLRNFQIARTNEMFDSRAISSRVAVSLYTSLLADPSSNDWVLQPLDAMAALSTTHDPSFDRWFVAALDRKEVAVALEIAELAKRRRFLATRALGGRLLALRTIMESPETVLSKEASLQRQQLLANFPAYRTLFDVGQKIYEQLRAGPILATNPAETKSLGALYENWETNANQRAALLAQLAVRRIPSSIEFPPLRTTADLQKSLAEGEALVVFHSAAGGLYGFLVTSTNVHAWQVQDPRRLRSGLADFLRALGNFGANKQFSATELRDKEWHEAAANAYTTLFANSRIDLKKTTSLAIVPDDVLWYLPFEALLPDGPKSDAVLADRIPIRYGPTAALAVRNPRPLRRLQHTGIVANEDAKNESAQIDDDMLKELETAVIGAVRLPAPMPVRGRLVAPLLEELIVFDEVALNQTTANGLAQLPRSRGAATETLDAWFSLPAGGPERMVLTGIATEAEQGLKGGRRSAGRGPVPGSQLFQAMCSSMANGARTILLTRWRTGGRTNFELVREFVSELSRVPATEAWQRACLLARESPLDPAHEPRMKKVDDTEEPPTADHPFFWAGYVLVDTEPLLEQADEAEPKENEAKGDAPAAEPEAKTPDAKPSDPNAPPQQSPATQPQPNGSVPEQTPTE